MNLLQKEKIKYFTNYAYDDIIKMSDIAFYKNITSIFVKGKINVKQYKWLEHQRLGETTQQLMNIFDGHYKGKTKSETEGETNCLC